MQTFGCTSCHAGQGSATDFPGAAHTPNDAKQTGQWVNEHDWQPQHSWDYPMLARRFQESACLKCHHQVTDLIRHGNQMEAPKLIRGYNLVKELGCFGCHEIAGIGNGRLIGPDLRLEPSPPLDGPHSGEQARLSADPLNRPGTMRKVGPSLRHLSEKTNEQWVARWIANPRGFRPDTKMPHYYGLSNNNPEALQGTDQEGLPAAEIDAITAYLFQESAAWLKDQERKNPALSPQPLSPEGRGAQISLSPPLRGRGAGVRGGRLGRQDNSSAAANYSRSAVVLPATATRPPPLPETVLLRWPVPLPSDQTSLDWPTSSARPAAMTTHAVPGLPSGFSIPALMIPGLRMPVTFLTASEANDVAAWLLRRTGEAGDQHAQDKVLPNSPAAMPAGPGDQHSERWHAGKKAITRLGCFGCHDIPGFEMAKPIGTPLNDWGKKNPDTLAFEDVLAYVAQHEQPYDDYFLQALQQQGRDGFLYQKLREPRSFDYHRDRTWDNRLRMPQFKFAHGPVHPTGSETRAQAEVREEAEGREAVMTFILGLVAEPVPLQYVHNPSPERLAQARGRQVLDKYNCAGCHQLQPGIYHFQRTPATLRELAAKVGDQQAGERDPADFSFTHNAWSGVLSPDSERRITLHAVPVPRQFDDIVDQSGGLMPLWLTQAVRFKLARGEAGTTAAGEHDIPAGEQISLDRKDLLTHSDPYGGALVECLTPYLVPDKPAPPRFHNVPDPDMARAALPPALLREGERVRPAWLFDYLRNPGKVRHQQQDGGIMVLRMPRYNLSDEEALALVDYFAAADKLANPGGAAVYPYTAIPQRDRDFWRRQNQVYRGRLGPVKVEAHAKDLSAAWQRFVDERRTGLTVDELKDQWRESDVYATDAFRLLVGPSSPCLGCHQVGSIGSEKKGPPLQLAAERLRPNGRCTGSPIPGACPRTCRPCR